MPSPASSPRIRPTSRREGQPYALQAGIVTAALARLTSDGTATMMVGTAVGGVAAYAWQAAGTRTLGSGRFAPVAAAWTVSFLVITVLLGPVEQYATRTIAAGSRGRAHLANSVPVIAMGLAMATAVLGTAAFALRGSLFRGESGYALVSASMVLCFGLALFVRGVLAGERDFRGYGRLTGLDGVTRLGAGLAVLALSGSPLLLAWTIPLSALISLLWLRRVPRRSEADASAGTGAPVRRFMATTIGGTAAAQLILAGGPLILALLGASSRSITVLFVTQTACRGAMLIALPAWARTLPVLTGIAVRNEHWRLGRIAEAILGVCLLVSLAVGALSAAVGPPILSAAFGHSSRPSAFLAAAIATGTVLAIGNLGLNQLLVASVRTHRITIVWWAALVASAAWVVLGPGSSLTRVAVAFVLGELMAMVGLTISSSPARAPAPVRALVRRLKTARAPVFNPRP